jgi:ATP-dependent Clp protease adaptor protein ClpS
MSVLIQDIDLMPATLPSRREAPTEQEERTGETGGPFVVILYNCDCHTFEQVEVQLQKATGCTLEKAEAFAKEVDTTGRAIVYAGSQEKCEQVAGILRQIRLQVETDRA